MPDNLVTVARFSLELEARLAKEALEDEGLTVQMISDFAGGSLPGLGDTVGGFVLQVPEADYQRAAEILEEVREEARRSAEHDATRTWLCPRCDAVINIDMEICPSCGALREEPESEAELATAVVRAEDVAALEEPLRVGDRLAARAFRAAVVGLLCCGAAFYFRSIFGLVALVGYFYSGVLLFRMLTYPGELSRSGMRKVYGVVVLNVIGLGLAVVVILYAFADFFWAFR